MKKIIFSGLTVICAFGVIAPEVSALERTSRSQGIRQSSRTMGGGYTPVSRTAATDDYSDVDLSDANLWDESASESASSDDGSSYEGMKDKKHKKDKKGKKDKKKKKKNKKGKHSVESEESGSDDPLAEESSLGSSEGLNDDFSGRYQTSLDETGDTSLEGDSNGTLLSDEEGTDDYKKHKKDKKKSKKDKKKKK